MPAVTKRGSTCRPGDHLEAPPFQRLATATKAPQVGLPKAQNAKEIGTPALAPRYRETQLLMVFDEGLPQDS
jgi:hypothetical protein